MAVQRCDLCLLVAKPKTATSPGRAILRFNLVRQVGDPKHHTTRGAGSILLCAECWGKVCKPRMISVVRQRRERAERKSLTRLALVTATIT